MNIALEKTEEFVNGKHRRSYGDAFVRGNNGMLYYGSEVEGARCSLLLADMEDLTLNCVVSPLVLYISAA